jgi:hypothetical protein
VNFFGDIGRFLWDVLNNWAGYATGGLLVAAFGLWFTWRDKAIPRHIVLALAVVFLLMAIYKAWHDQYAENMVAQEAGSMPLEAVTVFAIVAPESRSIQLELHFRNLKDRLIQYRVTRLNITIGAIVSNQTYATPVFLYARQEGIFRATMVPGVPNVDQVSGTLDYQVSYRSSGGSIERHSGKQMTFTIFNQINRINYGFVSESED